MEQQLQFVHHLIKFVKSTVLFHFTYLSTHNTKRRIKWNCDKNHLPESFNDCMMALIFVISLGTQY